MNLGSEFGYGLYGQSKVEQGLQECRNSELIASVDRAH